MAAKKWIVARCAAMVVIGIAVIVAGRTALRDSMQVSSDESRLAQSVSQTNNDRSGEESTPSVRKQESSTASARDATVRYLEKLRPISSKLNVINARASTAKTRAEKIAALRFAGDMFLESSLAIRGIDTVGVDPAAVDYALFVAATCDRAKQATSRLVDLAEKATAERDAGRYAELVAEVNRIEQDLQREVSNVGDRERAMREALKSRFGE